MTPILIAIMGSVGAVSRFVLDGHIRTRHTHVFPWATLIINISGSFILGVVIGLALHSHLGTFGEVVGIGFCGGYTTFSTASFETVRLLEQKEYQRAIGNTVGSLLATVIAAGLGIIVGQEM